MHKSKVSHKFGLFAIIRDPKSRIDCLGGPAKDELPNNVI